jgi:pilus assembly protein CpaB
MQRKVIGVVAAVLLAAVGTVALVGFVRGAEARALAGQETVDVLVVKDAVGRNTPAAELSSMVATERVPAKVRGADALDSIEDLEALDGKVTSADLVVGEQLVAARFVTPVQLAEQRSVDVPEGRQEVTISLEPQRAVGGALRPGELVGVLASFEWEDVPKHTTKLNHQQVLVTNVQADQSGAPTGGSDEEPEEGLAVAPTGNLLVTLAVDVEQAERIVFAAEHGTLWLTAQDEDTDQGGSTVRDGGNIYDE